MKNSFQILLFTALLGAMAFCGFVVCNRHFMTPSGGQVDHHHWIHTQLKITPEQKAKLDPLEHEFQHKKDGLVSQINAAHQELSDALRQDKGDSPRVKAAVTKIHSAQGQLQQAVLEHVFDMKSVLTDGQYERLIELTANALHDPSEP